MVFKLRELVSRIDGNKLLSLSLSLSLTHTHSLSLILIEYMTIFDWLMMSCLVCLYYTQHTSRLEAPLHNHLQSSRVQFIQFAFRWMNCLLMREVSLALIIRAWDTYLSFENGEGFESFHIYVCLAILKHFSKQLMVCESETERERINSNCYTC